MCPPANRIALCPQDLERQHAHIGTTVEFSIALMNKLDGINRHSFNSFRLRVGEALGRRAGRSGTAARLLASPGLSGVLYLPPTVKSPRHPFWTSTPQDGSYCFPAYHSYL